MKYSRKKKKYTVFSPALIFSNIFLAMKERSVKYRIVVNMNNTLCVITSATVLVYGQTDSNCTSTSTTGTHFMVAVPESTIKPDKIVLHITSTNMTNVTVKAPDIYFDRTFSIVDHIQVNLSSGIMHTSSGTSKKGIEIKCDKPCSVAVLPHHSNDAVEGFLAYPVNALSTKYVISSYDPNSGSSSEFLLAGIEDNTHVELTKHYGRYIDGNTLTFNKFNTYMFKSRYDLSDSMISSSKPIAVFSATGSSKIPNGYGDFQYIVEQMIPTKFWSKSYIVPALYPREEYLYRIYSAENDTSVIQHHDNATNTTLDSTTHISNLASNPSVIIADKPISVIQYCYDRDTMYGDPFMTTVQAISQFENTYEFITDFDRMNTGIWPVTLAITALSTDVSGILLDGSNSYIHLHGHKEPVPPPLDNYTVIYINMTSETFGSFHTLHHEFGKPFGATLYSLPGTAAGYGYPLKFALKDKVCQMPTTTTTTTTTMTTTTTTTTSTTAATTTTTLAITTTTPIPSSAKVSTTTEWNSATAFYINNNTGTNQSGIQCFDCRDIPHLKYCDKVTTCSLHEVCYVESYTKPHGEKLYRSGCIQKERCIPLSGQNDCLQCCESHDFCNMDGCEEEAQGSLSGGNRGPYCYDCSHLGENEKCHSVQICPSDQVCMVEKYTWGDNDFNYVMGCIRPHVCEARKRSIVDRKLNVRHAPVCTHCCSSDFCNQNCTHHYTPGIIG
ncbi:uncharacterized protein LOC128559542 isoform X3 [Mercenaria mercenaria]|uniref:uncharacterized protein LOC128559542 isoform X3 n=1 Tax=Mercenaria mercenaria TaxID=6596 RepID=UPI00234F5E88|nr:uncharacterized protein LOC128559542 isoform X3 [Mercenaria mercenaria]